MNRANQQFVQPASTFKIPNSLIGLTVGAVAGPDEVLPYRGIPTPSSRSGRDMSLRGHRLSNVPIYQELARRVGLAPMGEQVARLDYGNRDIGTRWTAFGSMARSRSAPWSRCAFSPAWRRAPCPSRGGPGGGAGHHPPGAGARLDIARKTGWWNAPGPGLGWWVGWVDRQGLYLRLCPESGHAPGGGCRQTAGTGQGESQGPGRALKFYRWGEWTNGETGARSSWRYNRSVTGRGAGQQGPKRGSGAALKGGAGGWAADPVGGRRERPPEPDLPGQGGTHQCAFPFLPPPGRATALAGGPLIRVPVVLEEARRRRASPSSTTWPIWWHGVSHSLGYDHMNGAEAARMERRNAGIQRGWTSRPLPDEPPRAPPTRHRFPEMACLGSSPSGAGATVPGLPRPSAPAP